MKRKLATIRRDDGQKCPFGLPIPWACKHASSVVHRMAPLKIVNEATEEEKQQVADANIKLLAWSLMHGVDEPGRCPYAGKVFPKHLEAVECNYEDSAPGKEQEGSTLAASPFYSSTFPGVGVSGMYSYPIGYYADYNISRNLFYGVFSLQGAPGTAHDQLIKWAEVLVEQRLESHANKSE